MIKSKQRRLGRPPAAESKDRLEGIVLAARRRFASDGFDAATLSGIAADSDISLAALYHYVDTKFDLYQLVFRETLQANWNSILDKFERMPPTGTLAGQLTNLITAIGERDDDGKRDFLAAAPIEMLRHPELAHLLVEREQSRERAYRAVVEPLVNDGGLPGITSLDDAMNLARIMFSGWAIEAFFHPRQRDTLTEGLIKLAELVDRGSQATSVRSSVAQPPRRRKAGVNGAAKRAPASKIVSKKQER